MPKVPVREVSPAALTARGQRDAAPHNANVESESSKADDGERREPHCWVQVQLVGVTLAKRPGGEPPGL